MSTPSIKDFYAGATVLVTGGSGFLGKAIIEKLMRSCTSVKAVYTLMRSKKGVSSEERLEHLKNNQVPANQYKYILLSCHYFTHFYYRYLTNLNWKTLKLFTNCAI